MNNLGLVRTTEYLLFEHAKAISEAILRCLRRRRDRLSSIVLIDNRAMPVREW
jgi:hypothetical protein